MQQLKPNLIFTLLTIWERILRGKISLALLTAEVRRGDVKIKQNSGMPGVISSKRGAHMTYNPEKNTMGVTYLYYP